MRAFRSWCVAPTTRTSIGISWRPPTRSMTRSCRKRSSLACSGIGRSPISSSISAAVGRLDLAEGGLGRAGEGALLVAEELALQQRLGDGRAVDGDEAALALGGVVQPCASTSLPVPLAQQQHGGVARGHLFDHAADALHAGVARDQAENTSLLCCVCSRRFSCCSS
jgi:hypothetical protein